MLVVAATMAITITLRKPPAPGQASQSATGAAEAGRSGSPRGVGPRTQGSLPSRSERAFSSTAQSGPEAFTVSVPDGHPQEIALAEKARKVEAEARFQLERMTKQLALSGEQRQRLFPILARTATDYDPAMVISKLPAGAPKLPGHESEKELQKVLDPPQRDQLVEDALADAALWEEIIGKLQQRLEEEMPQVPEPDPEPSEPAPSGPRRGNLFDSVAPGK